MAGEHGYGSFGPVYLASRYAFIKTLVHPRLFIALAGCLPANRPGGNAVDRHADPYTGLPTGGCTGRKPRERGFYGLCPSSAGGPEIPVAALAGYQLLPAQRPL